MIKNTILIENKVSITTKNNQLIIRTDQKDTSTPIEDLGFLVLDHPEIYLSLPAMNLLIENNSSIIVCNQSHLPNGMLLNLNSHHIQQEIFRKQINATIPLKKKLWQQTVIEKINNQSKLLEKITGEKNDLHIIASRVLSGDSSNMEGVAANFYWKIYFQKCIQKKISRERFGEYPNNFLNYGYAILRAAVARSLAGSGLLNTLGIHHKNKYNAFALADDIMEPYRPIVDEKVYEICNSYELDNLCTKTKSELLKILTQTVYFEKEKSPLMVGLQKTTSSLQQCFGGDRKKINYPKLWN